MRAVPGLVLVLAMLGLTRQEGADLASAWTAFLSTQWQLVRSNIATTSTQHRRHRKTRMGKVAKKSGEMMKLLDKIARYNNAAKFVPLSALFTNKIGFKGVKTQ